MTFSANYERPVPATLIVRLENGDEWEAGAADLEKFNLVDRSAAYWEWEKAYEKALREHAGFTGDITNARLNAVRYLVETAVSMPGLLDHVDHNGWRSVAAIERFLLEHGFEPEE